ncbi:putative internalin,Internalin-A precursor,Leucine Rich repeats (2 copies) [[Clostridium] sordellii]|uniref:leucine-rich repeat domain-containing protein n=1 Tax=Paraclostridium sordellii TaxID=1505 RepID=UPI00054437D5|nr:leucine-rich repeat domain-containing protein [Paeniclostridium sordellii]CEK36469.1 putative internalin,Internalin-A precursor,Leucine Rich repeats (2 copies) [[Clostridium] sordellii] [Paeniclostridium sordellii]
MFSKKSKKSIALSIITVFTVQTILQTNNIFALDKSIAKDLIINNDLESTTDNKESVNNNSGSTTDNKESVNNDSGSTTDNKEPVNNDSGSITDNKEPVNNDLESTTDNKEPVNNDSGPITDNKEPVNTISESETNSKEYLNKDSESANYSLNIPDKNLKKELERLIGAPLTIEKLNNYTGINDSKSLTLIRKDITNLEGIEHLKKITDLNLSYNNIENINPLKEMKQITDLKLSYNNIKNIESLKSLPSLDYINISNNKIKELPILSDTLTYLYASNNMLSDMSTIGHLRNLRYLDLSYNDITDMSVIGKLFKLKNLNLSHNKIKNLVVEEQNSWKTRINLSHNLIEDITPLIEVKYPPGIGLGNHIDLSNNLISDVSCINELPINFLSVTLDGNKIKDISPLRRVSNLSVANQEIELSPINSTDELAQVENIVFDMSKKRVSPNSISNGGIYNENTGIISWNNISEDINNEYTFSSKIYPNKNLYFSGKVKVKINFYDTTKQISVTVPTKMAFQVVSNTNNGVPELASGNYKIINNSEYKDINVYLESFTKSGGDFSVIKGTPVSGNNQVEMNLNLNTNNTNDIQIYDNFNKSTPLGKLKYKRDNSTENTMNLKFTGGDKIETGKDEKIAGKTFKNQFKFVFKFENVN